MNNSENNKDQLLHEIEQLRLRINELQVMEKKYNRAKTALKEIETRYLSLFDHVPLETVVVDTEGRVTAFNDAQKRSSRGAPQLGQIMFKDFDHSDELDLFQALSACIESDTPVEFEKIKREDRLVNICISPYSGGAIISTATLTDDKQTHPVKNHSERQIQFLTHILENASQPFAIMHPDGLLKIHNYAFGELTGFNKDELKEANMYSDLMPEKWHDVMMQSLKEISRSKIPRTFEIEIIPKDRKNLSVSIQIHPLYDNNGNLKFYCAYISDLSEQKKIEGALKKSQKRYHTLFENTGGATAIIDADTTIISVNTEFEDLCGYKKIDLIAKMKLTDFVSAQDLEKMMKSRTDVNLDNEPSPADSLLRFVDKQGKPKDVIFKTHMLNGHQMRVVSLFDITFFIKRDDAIKDRENRFRLIKDHPRDWEYWLNHEGHFEYVSPSCKKVTGHDPLDFQNNPELLINITHEADQEKLENHLIANLENPEETVLEFRILTKSGEKRWIHHTCHPVYDKDGLFLGRSAINSDITELRQLKEMLEAQHTQSRIIFQNAPVMVMGVHTDGHCFLWNNACVTQLGHTEEKALAADDIWPLIFSDPKEMNRIKDIFGNAEGIFREFTFRDKDHNKLAQMWASYPAGENQILSLGYDITETNHLKKRLSQCTAELQGMNEEMDQYYGFLSHELRAPFRAIQNYLNFFRDELESSPNAEQLRYVDGVGNAVEEGKVLLDDLRLYYQTGRQSISIEDVELGAFFKEVGDAFPSMPQVNIALKEDFPTIKTDRELLRRIFIHLVDNAIKFNQSSHKLIELGWSPVGDRHCEIFVRDNGIGIDTRYEEQIFDAFQRLHTRKEYPGTGMGLAIVRRALRLLNGSVRLESTVGDGSTFYVTVPMQLKLN